MIGQRRFTSDQFRAMAASKRRKIMGAEGTEHALQVECVRAFRLKYKHVGIIYAVPNGGLRDKTTAGKMVAEGALTGIPDLCIPVPRNGFGALYIEMKNGKKGRTSDNQNEVIETLRKLGNRVEVCRTMDQFMEIVKDYFGF